MRFEDGRGCRIPTVEVVDVAISKCFKNNLCVVRDIAPIFFVATRCSTAHDRTIRQTNDLYGGVTCFTAHLCDVHVSQFYRKIIRCNARSIVVEIDVTRFVTEVQVADCTTSDDDVVVTTVAWDFVSASLLSGSLEDLVGETYFFRQLFVH
ncbi:hypothetical protein D3C80_1712490 [compost metagenome]